MAAEKHTLELIADGASLSDILNHVCTSMDFIVASSMTTILLMDPGNSALQLRANTTNPFAGMTIFAEAWNPCSGAPDALIAPPLPATVGLTQLS